MSSVMQPGQSVDEPQPASQTFLSQGQGDRFDRWVEFFSAVVLSLATVLTAWSGYQAALWGGEQAKAYSEASAARIMAAQQNSQAMLRGSIHVGLFTEYAAAISEENQRLADFLYTRFPAELKTATDAWRATDPLNNPNAPLSPFDMPEYQLPQQVEAQRLEEQAAQKSAEADQANQQSDQYVLLTVIFAMVLFFGGISGKFQWRVIDLAMLGLGVIVLLGGLWFLLRSPLG
jgi:signal transduction histidine kinase